MLLKPCSCLLADAYRVKAKNTNPLMAFFASCPDNAFQRVPSGMEPFTLGQRFGAILRNGGKLLGVGFGASMLGKCCNV